MGGPEPEGGDLGPIPAQLSDQLGLNRRARPDLARFLFGLVCLEEARSLVPASRMRLGPHRELLPNMKRLNKWKRSTPLATQPISAP